eukprot:TRINITY_DN19733_c0_g1_i2.p1 TRINITY_DN19733_c0_g1~~TRINITY_DN19733_c0_g1_i2.p1  ORF type:complete len:381 (+),score=17.53 TRINITY_DN19733_c0_g1_i2:52-1194(+)
MPRPMMQVNSFSPCGSTFGRDYSYSVESQPTDESVTPLPSDIDSALLRATPLLQVLAGCGRHLRSIAAAENDYELSGPVSEMDDFLSHDWVTGRFRKLMALLFLYNNKDACIASGAVGIPVAFVGVKCNILWMQARFLCPIVWAFVMVFGQHLKALIGIRRKVFLDKLCIHQTDVDKKTAGILGLAGFLRASRRLVVLWSPRYFSRLWCSYELAAWCHLHSSAMRPVKFMPVSMPSVLLPYTMGLIFFFMFDAAVEKQDPLQQPGLYYLTVGSIMALLCPAITSALSLLQDMGDVPALQNYNMHETACFCCTHNTVYFLKDNVVLLNCPFLAYDCANNGNEQHQRSLLMLQGRFLVLSTLSCTTIPLCGICHCQMKVVDA